MSGTEIIIENKDGGYSISKQIGEGDYVRYYCTRHLKGDILNHDTDWDELNKNRIKLIADDLEKADIIISDVVGFWDEEELSLFEFFGCEVIKDNTRDPHVKLLMTHISCNTLTPFERNQLF